jgi:hypothetical protein
MPLLPRTYHEWTRATALSLAVSIIITLLAGLYAADSARSAVHGIKSLLFLLAFPAGLMCFFVRGGLRWAMAVLATLALLLSLMVPELAS